MVCESVVCPVTDAGHSLCGYDSHKGSCLTGSLDFAHDAQPVAAPDLLQIIVGETTLAEQAGEIDHL